MDILGQYEKQSSGSSSQGPAWKPSQEIGEGGFFGAVRNTAIRRENKGCKAGDVYTVCLCRYYDTGFSSHIFWERFRSRKCFPSKFYSDRSISIWKKKITKKNNHSSSGGKDLPLLNCWWLLLLLAYLQASCLQVLIQHVLRREMRGAYPISKQCKRRWRFILISTAKYPNETPVVTNPWYDNFNNMAQQLVNEGFLSSIPQDPSSGNAGYNYYNYLGPTIGALLVVNLETVSPTTVGPYGSCRPFGANWCSSTQASANYCLCNPY